MAPTQTSTEFFEMMGNALVNYPADHDVITVKMTQPEDTVSTREDSSTSTTETRDLEEHAPQVHAVSLTADQAGALKKHNDARAAKGVPALSWNAQLAADAQVWAASMAKTATFAHSSAASRPNEGENLYWRSINNTPTPLTDAVSMWLAEVVNYHGEAIPGGAFTSYGHYSQCMWNTTSAVGMALTQGSNGALYIVARYTLPGNWYGLKPY